MTSNSKTQALDLDRILDERIDFRFKSFPPGPGSSTSTIRDVAKRGWNVLDDFFMPAMVLKQSALRHNIRVMKAYCDKHGLSLAPHGKTPMSPQLFQMQLDAGAWGVTAATAWQVRVWRAFGAGRIVLANELVEPEAIRWIAAEQDRDDGFDFYCLVDSVAAVRLLEQTLADAGARRKIQVLLEMGMKGGRTGCRTREEALKVAGAISNVSHLSLAGIEGFEGIRDSVAEVDPFLEELRAVGEELAERGLFGDREVLLSAGGSAFPDRVMTAFDGAPRRYRVVLRSGCYLTHDGAHYKHASPFGSRLEGTDPLEEALEIWGVVLSMPEPGLALLGFGKRDVPYDLELPIPRMVKRRGAVLRPLRGSATIKSLNDQHAYMHLEGTDELAVGDLIGCGISHPCTAFDKWRLIPVVDDGYRVVDAVMTFF